MEPTTILGLAIIIGLVLVLLALGLRIYAVLGMAGVITGFFLVGPQSFNMIQLIPFSTTNLWTLIAVPLFVLVGFLSLSSGLSERLYAGAATFLARFPGGLLHTNIGACALFASITGSPSATAATIASVALPELEKRGYDEKMTLGSLAAGGVIGPLIPPSISMIIIGVLTNTSIGKLFFGGLIPGVILSLMFMIYIGFWAVTHSGGAPRGEKPTIKGLLIATKDFLPVLLIAIIMLGGIYLGVFSPTEAGAVGCVLVLMVGAIINRGLKWRPTLDSMRRTVEITSFIMLIVVGSAVLQNTLAALRIPANLTEWAISQAPSALIFLLFVFAFYLALGCVMDIIAVMIMSLPLFWPVAMGLGFDAIHFGVLIAVITLLAVITPPVGVCLYVVQQIRGKGSIADVYRGVIPFVFIMIGLVGIVYIFPVLSTWLPSLMIRR